MIITFAKSFGCDVLLKKEAIVSSDNIKLKDIALNCPSKYSNIIIGAAPYINNSIVISALYLKSFLLQRDIKLSICGAKKVRIIRKGFILSNSEILKILRLKNGTVLNKKMAVLPYSKHYKFKSKLLRKTKKLRYYVIEAFINDQLIKKIPITVQCPPGGALIPVARNDIEYGQIITGADIKYEKIVNIPPNTILSKSIIVGRVAASFIKKDKPFTLFNTKRYKPVKTGDVVKVKVVQGNILITTVAKALRGGYKGDIIPIMYLTSKMIRPALIIGKKLVAVR